MRVRHAVRQAVKKKLRVYTASEAMGLKVKSAIQIWTASPHVHVCARARYHNNHVHTPAVRYPAAGRQRSRDINIRIRTCHTCTRSNCALICLIVNRIKAPRNTHVTRDSPVFFYR